MNDVLMTLSQAAHWVSGRLLGADAGIYSVDTDSRRLQAGALFVALPGPRFDGHDYVGQVATAGAVGILVNRVLDTDLPQIVVTDTQVALALLAAAWRATLPGRVVGVTGSNGKTTTKEFIAKILGQAGTVAATLGNLNNAIGVPLTLLAANKQEFLVVEMGANHPGEIATLSVIAKPNVAIITNAGRAHLEGFGDVAGVAKAKGEIISGLNEDGVCVLNADDPWLPFWKELAGNKRVITFGRTPSADVTVEAVEVPLQLSATGFYNRVRLRTPRGKFTLELAFAGMHSLMNALAAVAVAEALEINFDAICGGLQAARPVAGRLCPLPFYVHNGAWVIDDSYNANPDSVKAALAVLSSLPAQHRWLALGDLGELGPEASNLHYHIGQDAKTAGIDHLWAVGTLSAAAVTAFGAGGQHFTNRDALSTALRAAIGTQDVILVKGSHSAGMEQVVTALTRSHTL